MKLRRLLRNLMLVTMPTLLICLVMLELFFRVGIPACEGPYAYYDAADQIMRFDTAGKREGLFTIGRFAEQRGRWRVNNYGWNSDIDYVEGAQRQKPLIAVIGDSYVEAFQVNIEDSISGVLRKTIGDQYDVYSFGGSGEPLSGYLQMSRYVNKHFNPDVLVFNIRHNDFDESVRELVNKPYCLQLSHKDGQFSEVPITPYKPSSMRRLLGRSALVRYLTLNLKIGAMLSRSKKGSQEFNSNIDVEAVMANREIVRQATSLLVKTIREENPTKEVVFVMDAPRQDIYAGTVNSSNVLWLHELLKEVCAENGSRFIDLTKPFTERFRNDGVKFNSDYDAHWNEVGHRAAAEVVYESLVEMGVVDPHAVAAR